MNAIGIKQASIKAQLLLLCLGCLSACTTLTVDSPWPSDLPDRKHFIGVATARLDANHPKFEQQLNSYLTWIKRFYHGSAIYPVGWHNMQAQVVESLQIESEQAEASLRLTQLGQTIATEWAHDNSISRISSSNIAAWGSALRTAAERGEQLAFIGVVEQDVDALLTGKLKKEDISSSERYYPIEDFDNF